MFYEKIANNFLNSAEQKIILWRMIEIVYAENSEQFYLIQKINFMNAIRIFEYTVNMMCREKILLTWKQILSMQKNKFDYCEI